MPYTSVTCTDGFSMGAYASAPSENLKGSVVVIQEIFGVNSHIRSVVDSYADNGFYAIAPAIFDRIQTSVELGYTEADMEFGIDLAFQQLDLEKTLLDLQSCINHANEKAKVGVVGYCFGGLLTWLSSCRLKNISAASAYYGGGIPDNAALTPACPTILHFGDQDAHIPMDSVQAFIAEQPGLPVYLYTADHGFNCDQRASYDADAAKLALERTLNLFNNNLVV